MTTYRADPLSRVVVRHDPDGIRPLVHHVKHSPGGHAWGYAGSGPAELARDLLWDLLGAEPVPSLYQDFKAAFIATAQIDVALAVKGEAVLAWVKDWQRDNRMTGLVEPSEVST